MSQFAEPFTDRQRIADHGAALVLAGVFDDADHRAVETFRGDLPGELLLFLLIGLVLSGDCAAARKAEHQDKSAAVDIREMRSEDGRHFSNVPNRQLEITLERFC